MFSHLDPPNIPTGLPDVFKNVIHDYLQLYKILPWINTSKLDWDYLSVNSATIDLLKSNPKKLIGFTYLKILVFFKLQYRKIRDEL
jgi:hypothetical protein